MSRKHALLSASGASKWLNCTPSAKLESKVKESTSTYADEGTLAHNLAQIELQYYFKRIKEYQYIEQLNEIKGNELYNDAMSEYVQDYVDYCIEHFNYYRPKAFIAIEETVYLEPYIQGGFSHLDFMIIGGTTLEIIDFKFGKGVPVYAENNKQALIYALGAFLGYAFMFDIETVRITIFQPRIDNISRWQLSVGNLLYWANNELQPKAKIAYAGKGELKAGEWCRFCKVKATCRAFADLNLNLAKLDFEGLNSLDLAASEKILNNNTQFLTDNEISLIVKGAEVFKNWLNGVLDYALKQAINGKQWPGLKVVHGRSMRRYTDQEKILKILEANKYFTEDITNKKLIPITELEKLLGKDTMQSLIGEYIVKPVGGPSLVLANDKRPVYDKHADAVKDFENL